MVNHSKIPVLKKTQTNIQKKKKTKNNKKKIMLISDKICFVEFGKTGCSFIREIFQKNKDGVLTKIHDPITDELILSDKIKVGSIRNPISVYFMVFWLFNAET